jgi:hypothetical protein
LTEKMPDTMKLYCMMVTEDGGKTWTVANVFYLAPTYYGESRGFLESSSFQNMKLVKTDE